MSQTQPLPTTVEALETKAREYKQAQNTKYHVSVAQHNIREINGALDNLEESLRDLKYYKTVLEKAFGGSAPTMTGSAVQAAEKAVAVNQEELLARVQHNEMASEEADLEDLDDGGQQGVQLTPEIETQISHARSAQNQVENVIEVIESQLKNERTEWQTKVSAAEQLQQILGSQSSDFARTLNRMQNLLRRDLLDSSGSASNFVSQWNSATNDWEKHQSLQSFDKFQEKHELSDTTIEDIKDLSKSRQLTLADVSLQSLEEMKGVPELESAVELSL